MLGYRGRLSGGHSIRSYRSADADFNRVVFLCEGRQVAVDFLPHGRKPFRIAEIQDGQRVATQRFTEASGVSGFVDRLMGQKKSAEPEKTAAVESEPELPVLKSDAYAKDILRGSEVFKDAERKIRLFLRGAGGLGKQQLFVLFGQGGTGKSIAAREALLAECGTETSSAEIHKRLKQSIAFDPEDFKVRMAANQARDQARNLYTRYLHNYTLSRKEDTLVPETDADLKNKALEKVKDVLKDQLYGYELTLDDVEGHGTRVKKTASDPVEKLKKLSGDDARQPYHQANGWTEAPNEMSNEDLYFQCYVTNAATTFIDEGDYFLSKSNPMMKIVTDNKQFRRLSSGSKSGFAEINGFILPDSFWYSGRMVITTNLTPREWDDPIRTRAASYGLYLSLDQMFDRLRDILPKIQTNDLPHLPPVVLTGIRNILKKFSDQGELKQFDFRTFVMLADEYALMIEDTVKEAVAENPEFPAFSPYVQKDETLDAADERFRNWRQTPEGQQIAQRVGKKFRKIILNQIQAMNRAHDRDANIVELKPQTEEAE